MIPTYAILADIYGSVIQPRRGKDTSKAKKERKARARELTRQNQAKRETK